MGKLNNYTGLLCVAILCILGYQIFSANKEDKATSSFLGKRK